MVKCACLLLKPFPSDIPPCDENEEDAYAIFRYLEECAIEQGAQLRMNPYITLEVGFGK